MGELGVELLGIGDPHLPEARAADRVTAFQEVLGADVDVGGELGERIGELLPEVSDGIRPLRRIEPERRSELDERVESACTCRRDGMSRRSRSGPGRG